MAQVDIFMKIDDVKGESADDKHKGEIDVVSWSWVTTQTGSSQAGSGSGQGKAQVGDLTFVVRDMERSIPVLHRMCVTGTTFKKAQLTLRKAGGNPLEHTKIVMEGGLISNVKLGGSGDGGIAHTVEVSLNFGKYSLTYTPQKPDGSGDADITYGFDIGANKAQ